MIIHKLSILELAAYYEKSLTDQQVKIYSEQLAEFLTAEEAAAAVKLYINDPANEFFPRPVSKLIVLVKKPVDNKDQAQNVVNLIKKAVVNHQSGWTQGYFDHYDDNRQPVWVYFDQKGQRFESWRDAATSDLGPAALTVIDRLGGWKQICERFDQEPEGVVLGQLVKNVESIINIAEVGKLDDKPHLPGPNATLLQLVNIKTLNELEKG